MPSSPTARPPDRVPRRPLRRVPRRALPPGARRARGRVLHPGRVEGRPPAPLVVLSQLQIVALTVHPHGDVADAGPRIEPGAERVERAVVRGHRAPSEADSSTQKLPALVEHGYWMISSARPSTDCGIVSPSALYSSEQFSDQKTE